MIDRYTLPYVEPSAKAAMAGAGTTDSRLLAAEIGGYAL